MKSLFTPFLVVLLLAALTAPALAAPAVPSPTKAAPAKSAKVDLNTASLADLQTLPGIGPRTAELIVNWRKENGRFSRVEDLLAIKGIGEKKLAQLRDRVTVN